MTTIAGRYRLDHLLSRNDDQRWQGFDLRTRNTVMVQLVRKKVDEIEKLQRKLHLLKRFRHCIVPLLDIETTPTSVYLIFAWADQGTLKEFVRAKKTAMDETTAKTFLLQMIPIVSDMPCFPYFLPESWLLFSRSYYPMEDSMDENVPIRILLSDKVLESKEEEPKKDEMRMIGELLLYMLSGTQMMSPLCTDFVEYCVVRNMTSSPTDHPFLRKAAPDSFFLHVVGKKEKEEKQKQGVKNHKARWILALAHEIETQIENATDYVMMMMPDLTHADVLSLAVKGLSLLEEDIMKKQKSELVGEFVAALRWAEGVRKRVSMPPHHFIPSADALLFDIAIHCCHAGAHYETMGQQENAIRMYDKAHQCLDQDHPCETMRQIMRLVERRRGMCNKSRTIY